MNPPDAQPESRWVSCPCQHCSGHLEFDANLLDQGETRPVPCPHCGEETLIHAPTPCVPPVELPPLSALDAESPLTDYSNEARQVAWWCRRAAEYGDPVGQERFGTRLSTGAGLPQDHTEAVHWLRKSAQQGNCKAQWNLATCYWNGHGVAVDRFEAIAWMRRAADQGYPDAQYGLGCASCTGDGIPENHTEGADWFRKAAEQGHAIAQLNLSVLYGKGDGVGLDVVEAYKWAALAAAQNEGGATERCTKLASEMTAEQLQDSLSRVEEFQRNFKPYPGAQADVHLDMLRRMANRGDIEAQQFLADSSEDAVEAMKWVRQVAEQGSLLAQHRLGVAYLKGDGVSANHAEALKWLRKAAEQGLVPAMIDLGWAYFRGVGVPQNYVEAYRWANLAAASGLENALSLREQLASQMTAKQIAQAQRLSAEKPEQSSGRQPIPSEVRREVWRRDQGRCTKCGSRENLEYDHIIPVAKGGSNTVRNIELLCESCNRSKSHSIQ